MSDVQAFIARYAKTAGAFLSLSAVSYALVMHTPIGPPLKPRAAVLALSVLFEVHALTRVQASPRRLSPPLTPFLAAIVLYLISMLALTFPIPTAQSGYRDAEGFLCTAEFVASYGPNCRWPSDAVLADHAYEPERIWEPWTVLVVRGVLALEWLGLIWLTATCIAVLVRRDERRAARGGRGRRSA